ncbi:MAG: hypothetical protein MK135_12865 [Polyangiaceae bacterium]|nr:hypothetical protein [Polyangiaceae bacterium]
MRAWKFLGASFLTSGCVFYGAEYQECLDTAAGCSGLEAAENSAGSGGSTAAIDGATAESTEDQLMTEGSTNDLPSNSTEEEVPNSSTNPDPDASTPGVDGEDLVGPIFSISELNAGVTSFVEIWNSGDTIGSLGGYTLSVLTVSGYTVEECSLQASETLEPDSYTLTRLAKTCPDEAQCLNCDLALQENQRVELRSPDNVIVDSVIFPSLSSPEYPGEQGSYAETPPGSGIFCASERSPGNKNTGDCD